MARNKKSNKPSGRAPDAGNPPPFDRRQMDEMIASLHALLADRNFESSEEANAFLQELMRSGQPLPPPPTNTPLEKAQALMYEAFRTQHRPKRIRLARKALQISPDCADAWVLLASESAPTAQEANKLFANGMAAGRRALGAAFDEMTGHFWGIPETRPYMRALVGYADTLWDMGRQDAAITHWQESLRLNPNDNQGVRSMLAGRLLQRGRLDDFDTLIATYDDDVSTDMLYARALAAFMRAGAGRSSRALLEEALAANPFVPAVLFGAPPQADALPDAYMPGSPEEAVAYGYYNHALWAGVDGALAWLSSRPDMDEDDQAEQATEVSEALTLVRTLSIGKLIELSNLPPAEQERVQQAFISALDNYMGEVEGQKPDRHWLTEHLEEYMAAPYMFGMGVLEMLRDPQIGEETRLRFLRYCLLRTQRHIELGLPFGFLVIIYKLLAAHDVGFGSVESAVTALDFSDPLVGIRHINWLAGFTIEDALGLSELIVRQPLPADERAWYGWRLALESEDEPHMTRALADFWLGTDALPVASRLALCHAWLEHAMAFGTPPVRWRFEQALEMDAFSVASALVKRHNLPLPDAIAASLHEKAAQSGASEELPTETIPHFMLVPTALRRRAVAGLVALGEDFERVVEQYWETDSQYERDALRLGVADAIAAQGDRLDDARRRALIERGIAAGQAQVRKGFYLLSVQFYGAEYLPRAREDAAKVVRDWAAQKLARHD